MEVDLPPPMIPNNWESVDDRCLIGEWGGWEGQVGAGWVQGGVDEGVGQVGVMVSPLVCRSTGFAVGGMVSSGSKELQ